MCRTRRRLTMLDAMILVATAAAGLAAARAYFVAELYPSSISMLRVTVASYESYARALLAVERFNGGATPGSSQSVAAVQQKVAAFERRISLEKVSSAFPAFLAVWTLGLVLLGLRKPRPRLRRMAHDAGWAGCLTAVVVLAVRVVSEIVTSGVESPGSAPSPWRACAAGLGDLGFYAGPAVVAAWVLLATGGRCRPDRSALGWLTLIAATSWVVLAFRGAAIAVLARI